MAMSAFKVLKEFDNLRRNGAAKVEHAKVNRKFQTSPIFRKDRANTLQDKLNQITPPVIPTPKKARRDTKGQPITQAGHPTDQDWVKIVKKKGKGQDKRQHGRYKEGAV